MRRYSEKHQYIQFHGRQTKICVDVHLSDKEGQFTIDIPKLNIHISCDSREMIEEKILHSINAFMLVRRNNHFEDSIMALGFNEMQIFTPNGKRTPREMEPEPDVARILTIEDRNENVPSEEVKTYTFEYVRKYQKPEPVDLPDS